MAAQAQKGNCEAKILADALRRERGRRGPKKGISTQEEALALMGVSVQVEGGAARLQPWEQASGAAVQEG